MQNDFAVQRYQAHLFVLAECPGKDKHMVNDMRLFDSIRQTQGIIAHVSDRLHGDYIRHVSVGAVFESSPIGDSPNPLRSRTTQHRRHIKPIRQAQLLHFFDYYSHNDSAGDYDMSAFSIARHRQYVIPFIKEAMKLRPDLRMWGSPWTPPENGAKPGPG